MQLRPEEGKIQPGQDEEVGCACESPICHATIIEGVEVCLANQMQAKVEPGVIEGRYWWQQQSAYWELPFYSEFGWNAGAVGTFDEFTPAREALWAIREGLS